MIKKRIFLNILAGCLLFGFMTLFNMEPEQTIPLTNLTGKLDERILTGEPCEKIMQYFAKNYASEWIKNNPGSAGNLIHSLCESFGPGLAKEMAREIARQAIIVSNKDEEKTISVAINFLKDQVTNAQLAPVEMTLSPKERLLVQLPRELEPDWQTGFKTKISGRAIGLGDPVSGNVQLTLNAKSSIAVREGYRKINITRNGSSIGPMHLKRNMFSESCRPYPNCRFGLTCLGRPIP